MTNTDKWMTNTNKWMKNERVRPRGGSPTQRNGAMSGARMDGLFLAREGPFGGVGDVADLELDEFGLGDAGGAEDGDFG